jgi:hypothetical protein
MHTLCCFLFLACLAHVTYSLTHLPPPNKNFSVLLGVSFTSSSILPHVIWLVVTRLIFLSTLEFSCEHSDNRYGQYWRSPKSRMSPHIMHKRFYNTFNSRFSSKPGTRQHLFLTPIYHKELTAHRWCARGPTPSDKLEMV